MRPLVTRARTRILIASLLLAAFGCGRSRPESQAVAKPTSPAEGEASAELRQALSKIINEEEVRFRPLDYQYDEDLLVIIDQAEAFLASGKPGPSPKELPRLDGQRLASIDSKTGILRSMPRLSTDEELDHFRETIRRWESKHGKKLRPELDALKADVAARKPGDPPFHPEFHKRFSLAFDDFIALEVAEIRERRNRAIHERTKPIFDRLRDTYPELVRENEAFLDRPPYNLVSATAPAKP